MDVKQRLATFPDDFSDICPVPAEDFAKAGFVYEGPDDRVKCAFGRNESLNEWEEGEDPMEEHAKHFPNCSFVTGDNQVGEVEKDLRAGEATNQQTEDSIFENPPFKGPNKGELPGDTDDDEKDDAKKPKS